MARKVLWAVLVLGALMIAAPFALGLPSKAAAGQRMMDDFRPLMQPADVDTTAAYYNEVFVPLGKVVPAMTSDNIAKFQGYSDGIGAMGTDAQKFVPALAEAMHMTPAQVQGYMASQFPAMSAMLQNLATMQQDFVGLITLMANNVAIFQQVPGGLAHYKPLVSTMQANVSDFDKADSLPNMNLFSWFFVVPGALLAAFAGAGLYATRRSALFEAMVPRPVPAEELIGR